MNLMKSALVMALGLALSVTGCATATKEPATPPAAAAPAAPAPPQTPDPLAKASQVAPQPFEGSGWDRMFDGTLDGWKETDFAGHGEVEIRHDLLVLNMGDPFTGVNWTKPFPNMNYEIALDAMRFMGTDFFCGLTVPVGDSFCSLIVGGWGGGVVGISSLDGLDASENETTKYMNFKTGEWYRIRLRVSPGRIEAWIGGEKTADVDTTDKRIALRPGEIDKSKPLGIASWQSGGAFREIKFRRVDGPADPKRKAL